MFQTDRDLGGGVSLQGDHDPARSVIEVRSIGPKGVRLAGTQRVDRRDSDHVVQAAITALMDRVAKDLLRARP